MTQYTRVGFPHSHADLGKGFKLYVKESNSKRRLKIVSKTCRTTFRSMREAQRIFDLELLLSASESTIVDLQNVASSAQTSINHLQDELVRCQELCKQLATSEEEKVSRIKFLENYVDLTHLN